jgi:hypothetical protein
MSKEKPPLTLHIGHRKTGTTWLQTAVFPYNEELAYLGKPIKSRQLIDLIYSIRKKPDQAFDSNRIADQLSKIIDKEVTQEKPILISREDLSHTPDHIERHPFVTARRLKQIEMKLDRKIKIIIGIRNQVNALASQYAQSIEAGNPYSFSDFLFNPLLKTSNFLQCYRYDKIIGKYYDLFGADNIYVYLQERLKNEQRVVLEEMFDHIGVGFSPPNEEKVDTNPRLSKPALVMMRIINCFFKTKRYQPGTFNPVQACIKLAAYIGAHTGWWDKKLKKRSKAPIKRAHTPKLDQVANLRIHRFLRSRVKWIDQTITGGKPSFVLPNDVRHYLAKQYADSNERTNEMLDVDLKLYDYPLPENIQKD